MQQYRTVSELIKKGELSGALKLLETLQGVSQTQKRLLLSEIYEKLGLVQRSSEQISFLLKQSNLMYLEKRKIELQNLYTMWRMGSIDSCIKEIKKHSLTYTTKDEMRICGRFANIFGLIYWTRGKEMTDPTSLRMALQFHLHSLEIRIRLGDATEMAYSFNNLGNTFMSLGDKSQAFEYLTIALSVRKHLNVQPDIATTLRDLGRFHLTMGDLSEAESYLLQSLEIREKLNNPFDLAKCHLTLGEIYVKQAKKDGAIFHFTNSIDYFSQIGHNSQIQKIKDQISKLTQ